MTENNAVKIDTKGIGKPLTKLIEAVRAACGAVFEPYRITRKAKAEANAKIILALSDHQARMLGQISEQGLALQAEEFNASRQQKNIFNVVNKAVELLPEAVDDATPSEDWLVKAFKNFQDISDEDMQTLWAKILAGEIARSGSFSFRTMNIVSNLSKSEAETFTKIAQYFVFLEGRYWFFLAFNDYQPYEQYATQKFNVGDSLLLADAGLINANPGMLVWPIAMRAPFQYHNEKITFQVPSRYGRNGFIVEPRFLTASGSELMSISSHKFNPEFWDLFTKAIAQG